MVIITIIHINITTTLDAKQMPKPSKAQRVLAQIYKNVANKKFPCSYSGCGKPSINSHLLQRNGILNNIAENGHMVEIKQTDIFKWTPNTPTLAFKTVGINSAISLPVFCNEHDTGLFKDIESENIDFESYRSQLLFSYRTLCSELRKKETNLLTHERILQAETLKGEIDEFEIKQFIDGTNRGIQDLLLYKRLFEEEITTPSNNFHFKTYSYPLIRVYGSATFSPINSRIDNPLQSEPFKSMFIHVIPQKEDLKIIVGYNKSYSSDWIEEYTDSWNNLTYIELQQNLTELFATRIESWGMSISTYNSIGQSKINAFIDYWNRNAMNLLVDQRIGINLFEKSI
ncbi:hypothetical protein [Reichenbachiella versicolor]|uniref:hypothetical protein n=1 Tax=Reichenbachiella versicolor TaxID=1821036 RepID=UPI000D6E769A|nr:hypothetical protein [Reichenbachiella versicolor]